MMHSYDDDLAIVNPAASRHRRRVSWGIFALACAAWTTTLLVLNQQERVRAALQASIEARAAQRDRSIDITLNRAVSGLATLEESWETLHHDYPELQRLGEGRDDGRIQGSSSAGSPARELAILDPVAGTRYVLRKVGDGWEMNILSSAVSAPAAAEAWRSMQNFRLEAKRSAPFAYLVALLGFVHPRWRRRGSDVLLGIGIIFAVALLTDMSLPSRADWTLAGTFLALSGILMAIIWRQERIDYNPRCRTCGYNLTGNVSGVCPECGMAVARKNA